MRQPSILIPHRTSLHHSTLIPFCFYCNQALTVRHDSQKQLNKRVCFEVENGLGVKWCREAVGCRTFPPFNQRERFLERHITMVMERLPILKSVGAYERLVSKPLVSKPGVPYLTRFPEVKRLFVRVQHALTPLRNLVVVAQYLQTLSLNNRCRFSRLV